MSRVILAQTFHTDHIRRTINLGKYGGFKANDIIGRPYYITFEILDKTDADVSTKPALRMIPAAELYASLNDEDISTPSESETLGASKAEGGVQYDIVGEDGEVIMRTNRKIVDDSNSQILTMEEIEVLKASGTGSGKELVTKILESHSALDQKTAFALAKYTLRKTKKYLRRFTVLPLDVAMLARWIMCEKEAAKIMEMREEMLALIGSWSNVHFTPAESTSPESKVGRGRWLVLDDKAGLLTAYMAEKMGLLHSESTEQQCTEEAETCSTNDSGAVGDAIDTQHEADGVPGPPTQEPQTRSRRNNLPSTTNTLTVLHSPSQPNLSLLRYFSFDPFNPPPSHPLTTHLKTLSWLQLLDPTADAGYTEPPLSTPEEISNWKSGKRSNYYRKRRRWERIKAIVDETRSGGFDGLVIASVMSPISVLHHLVPLLRGAAQVVVYSPHLEPLAALADCYSTARKTAFLSNPPPAEDMPTEDFPVDPRLLLAPTLQTSRARAWQVLPGRTHPLMMGKGGAGGFVFTATRVLPAEGKVEARGRFKRRKVGEEVVEGGGAVAGPAKESMGGEHKAENDLGDGNMEARQA